jgi:hypothetical protein
MSCGMSQLSGLTLKAKLKTKLQNQLPIWPTNLHNYQIIYNL